MRSSFRLLTVFAALSTLALAGHAQTREGLMGDLIKDIDGVQTKIVGLAKAMPPASYEWRPGKDVRSTGQVFMHVAADNYFMPAAMGTNPPAETGISAKDYKTTIAFEQKKVTPEQIVAELEKSFAFLKSSMANTPDAKLDAPLEVFGQKTTLRSLWVMTTTHLHEHLGQLIAYARSNNVTPPWSK